MSGKAYCVGVGPGDPELMTIKAARMIREHHVIAFPGREADASTAYRIAAQAVPDISQKELLPIDLPMVRDEAKRAASHRRGAEQIEAYLKKGESVVYLTLGDPTVYCTFHYLKRLLEADGFETELVSGVTSFCAAAARLNTSLGEWDEPIHIIPAAHQHNEPLRGKGTYVMMKSGRRMSEVQKLLKDSGRRAGLVENCGMANEKIYRDLDSMPDETGYFSVIISKEQNND